MNRPTLLGTLHLPNYEIQISYRETSKSTGCSPPNADDVFNVVMAKTGVNKSLIRSHKRPENIVRARFLCCWLLHEHCGLPNSAIAKLINRDISAVYYAISNSKRLSGTDKAFAKLASEARTSLLHHAVQSLWKEDASVGGPEQPSAMGQGMA